MSGPVVTIRGGPCRRRKNVQQDDETIRLRRMIHSMESAAFADTRDDTLEDRTQALCLSWAAERRLPCSQLRIIAGTLDERQDFEVRLLDVQIARAEREAHDAKRWRARTLYGEETAKAMSGESERLFERYRQTVMDVARTPALTKRDIARKRSAIGSVWLGAEGRWYDQLRAAVAADEERLADKRA